MQGMEWRVKSWHLPSALHMFIHLLCNNPVRQVFLLHMRNPGQIGWVVCCPRSHTECGRAGIPIQAAWSGACGLYTLQAVVYPCLHCNMLLQFSSSSLWRFVFLIFIIPDVVILKYKMHSTGTTVQNWLY